MYIFSVLCLNDAGMRLSWGKMSPVHTLTPGSLMPILILSFLNPQFFQLKFCLFLIWPCVFWMPYPCHRWFHHISNMWWIVKVMKHLNTSFCPLFLFSHTLILFSLGFSGCIVSSLQHCFGLSHTVCWNPGVSASGMRSANSAAPAWKLFFYIMHS